MQESILDKKLSTLKRRGDVYQLLKYLPEIDGKITKIGGC